MSKVKHLGDFNNGGDYIELPFFLTEGKYRVEIKPSGQNRRNKTITVSNDGVLRLPNIGSKKAFAEGSNIFSIYEIVGGDKNRMWIDGSDSFSLFLVPSKDVIELIDGNTIKINFGNDAFLLRIVSHHNESVHSLQIEKL